MTIETAQAKPALTLPLSAVRGVGRSYGTVTHLVFGTTRDGASFAAPLPLQAVSTAEIRIRAAKERTLKGFENSVLPRKATELFLDELGLDAADVTLRAKSMMYRGRGMGDAEADVIATLNALANALEVPLAPTKAARLLTAASGLPAGLSAAVYRNMALLEVRSGKPFSEHRGAAQLSYAYVIPKDLKVREGLLPHPDHEELFADARDSLSADAATLGALGTRSAKISHLQAPHDLGDFLLSDLAPAFTSRGLPAPLGVAFSANSHAAAVLFDASRQGRNASSTATAVLRQEFGDDCWYGVATSHKPVD